MFKFKEEVNSKSRIFNERHAENSKNDRNYNKNKYQKGKYQGRNCKQTLVVIKDINFELNDMNSNKFDWKNFITMLEELKKNLNLLVK